MKYRQVGSGEIIVMIPPPLADHRVYCQIQNKMRSQYRTVALDLPQTRDLDTVITTLKHLIDLGTTQDFHVFATSAAAWIAQYIAQYYPDRLQTLTLVNGIYTNNRYTTKHKVAVKSSKFIPWFKFRKEVISNSKILLKGIDNTRKLEEYFKTRVKDLGKSSIRDQLYWLVKERKPPSKLEIPVQVLFSTQDPVFKKSEQQELLNAHSNSKSISYHTNAHLLHIAREFEVINELDTFIKSN